MCTNFHLFHLPLCTCKCVHNYINHSSHAQLEHPSITYIQVAGPPKYLTTIVSLLDNTSFAMHTCWRKQDTSVLLQIHSRAKGVWNDCRRKQSFCAGVFWTVPATDSRQSSEGALDVYFFSFTIKWHVSSFVIRLRLPMQPCSRS